MGRNNVNTINFLNVTNNATTYICHISHTKWIKSKFQFEIFNNAMAWKHHSQSIIKLCHDCWCMYTPMKIGYITNTKFSNVDQDYPHINMTLHFIIIWYCSLCQSLNNHHDFYYKKIKMENINRVHTRLLDNTWKGTFHQIQSKLPLWDLHDWLKTIINNLESKLFP
jgi:hypothetical protein